MMMRSLVLSLSLVVVASCSAKEPAVNCTASRADFAAKYTLVSGDVACAMDLVHMTGMDMSLGETLGVQSFVANPKDPGDGLGSMAVKSATAPLALGKFTTLVADDNDVCKVTNLPSSDKTMTPRYDWKNVEVFVNASEVGVQFGGELTVTGDNCTATFKAVAISPPVMCADMDKNGNMVANDDNCNPDNGLSPSIAAVCDKAMLVCVAKNPFPSNN